ncbi:hypothetical protein [Halobacillus sp. K22]|uniref:hypothetical protein n=1 Tax=Halobacillus sp. K22 TaxID=3457431 RepID=UPI003FCCB5D6
MTIITVVVLILLFTTAKSRNWQEEQAHREEKESEYESIRHSLKELRHVEAHSEHLNKMN